MLELRQRVNKVKFIGQYFNYTNSRTTFFKGRDPVKDKLDILIFRCVVLYMQKVFYLGGVTWGGVRLRLHSTEKTAVLP